MAAAEAFFARSLPTSSQCGKRHAKLFEVAAVFSEERNAASFTGSRAHLL
jgi:hypothetical protein